MGASSADLGASPLAVQPISYISRAGWRKRHQSLIGASLPCCGRV